MSGIFGFWGRLDDETARRAASISGRAARWRSDRGWLTFDERPATEGGLVRPGQGAVAFSGLGISGSGLWNVEAWASGQNPEIGHWARVHLGAEGVRLDTDPFGLRSMYCAPDRNGWWFGSDAARVARARGTGVARPDALGSHWLLHNQLGCHALQQDVERISGGLALIDASGLSRQPAQADRTQLSGARIDPKEALRRVLHHPLGGLTASLGLSGGLDSRTLLALTPDRTQLHTFGSDEKPDVRQALRLAQAIGRPIRQFDASLPDPGTCRELWERTAIQNQAATPASACLDLAYPARLAESGCVMVDGGFGEVGRRVFMGRLTRTHSRLPSDPAAVAPHLGFDRGGFLSTEFRAVLDDGARDAVETAMEPGADTAEWADRMGLEHRLPNFFGYEQARLDAIGPAFMPFAQPGVVQALLGTDVRARRNGRLFKRIIRSARPELARIPLVKGDASYPFGWPPLLAYAAAKLKRRRPSADHRLAFLQHCLEPIRDMAHERQVRECGWYDVPALQAASGSPSRENAEALDWWISLESWRRSWAGHH